MELKVSIITAVYNRATTIADTLESVRGQDYPEIEHIVVDGMSTDGTQEVISRYRSGIARMVRERDSGIYEALNKGIGLASGDIIGFLHADDIYADSGVVSSIVEGIRGLGTADRWGLR